MPDENKGLCLYGIKACDTMKKARTWLDQQGLGEETRLYSEKFLQSASSR